MAKKISELTALAAPETTDYVPIVDVSGTETKRSTLDELLTVRVMDGGTLQGRRKNINFIAGPDTTVTVTDDSANDKVDVTITTALGPNSPAHKLFLATNFR